MAYNISAEANADLKSIARYTKKNWGISQRNLYLNQLYDAFDDLAHKRIAGCACLELAENCHKYHIGKHTIFYYELDPSRIRVVRVLHESMNFELHF